MNLPWKKEKSEHQMLKDEMKRLVEVMRHSSPEDPTYVTAFEAYRKLRAQELVYNKTRAYKWGRVVDIIGTFGLAGIVLTHEYWTPITSDWAHSLTRPFNHNDSGLL